MCGRNGVRCSLACAPHDLSPVVTHGLPGQAGVGSVTHAPEKGRARPGVVVASRTAAQPSRHQGSFGASPTLVSRTSTLFALSERMWSAALLFMTATRLVSPTRAPE